MCDDLRQLSTREQMIDSLQGTTLGMTEKDYRQTKEAIRLFRADCRRCQTEARNDFKCSSVASANYERRLPHNRNKIYPYVNYDWDYGNYISNHYAPRYTGVTNNGTFQDVINNTRAFSRLLGGFISDPIPNSRSVANRKDPNSDYPDMDACANSPMCTVTQQIRNGFTQDKPYSDPTGFLNKDLTGENSSSFYVEVGTCRKPSIKNQSDCEVKGYTWKPSVLDTGEESGTCEAPRYMFVDNTPKTFVDGSKMKGLIPSVANDFLSLMPDKLFAALMGQSVTGQFAVQPCVEEFEGQRRDMLQEASAEQRAIFIAFIVLIGLSVLYFGGLFVLKWLRSNEWI